MIKRVIRWIMAPTRKARERLEAQRVYDQLVATMRDEWRVVETHQTPCFFDAAHKHFAGHLTIVAETNELNERRARVVSIPPMFVPEQSRQWANYQVWAMRAEPTRPPRQPVELPL